MICFQKVINNILLNYNSSSYYEIIFVLTTMLIQLAKYSNIRSQIINESIAEQLYNIMELTINCPLLFVEILKCIRLYVNEPVMLDKLIEMNVAEIIVNCLNYSSNAVNQSLKSTVANFITVSCQHNEICDQFIDNGVLDW